jgi:hypothetical protein
LCPFIKIKIEPFGTNLCAKTSADEKVINILWSSLGFYGILILILFYLILYVLTFPWYLIAYHHVTKASFSMMSGAGGMGKDFFGLNKQ